MIRRFAGAIALLVSGFAAAQSGLVIDISSRSAGPQDVPIEAAAKQFAKNAAQLTRPARLRWARYQRPPVSFALPTTVRLRQGGRILPPPSRAPGDLTLQFETTGSRSFPESYRTQLQSVFNSVRPTLNALFGVPNVGGTVRVLNYDADIGDRDAVSGGLYIPNNGANQREIRFPVYVSPEAAAVNFVHTLLLAYLPASGFGFDAFDEGLARAGTMRAVRSAGALPATLDPNQVEAVLDSTYDVGSFYDWYNQRALGARQFIAPNLRSVPLPAGGSLGGIYLLRYQMAGSAWQKVLTENPGFSARFNQLVANDPTASGNRTALIGFAQQALDQAAGVANATIEGQSFANWARRQFILETADTRGPKLLVQPIPIVGGLAGSDYGVFDVSATYFESQVGGNEVLLSATSFPIFWDQNYNRIFPGAQVDRMDIAGAYGSVTPNLPDLNGGRVYRSVAEVPVADRIARVYLPAGAIATAGRPVPNTIYGTVIGAAPNAGQLRVRVRIGTTQILETPVTNGAFGANLDRADFNGFARLRVEVVRVTGTTVESLLIRSVNKGPGQLALDLRIGGEANLSVPLAKGLQTFGLTASPWSSLAGELLGVNENQVLVARYDATTSSFDLYPDSGSPDQGLGAFLRREAAGTVTVPAQGHPGQAVSVALRPGWNLISNPLGEVVPFSRVQVVRATQAPKPYSEAVGVELASQIFGFSPGANDPATGAPETGIYNVLTSFITGRAVFVRVLAPEGVTLVFFPTGSILRPGRTQTFNGWRMRVQIASARERALSEIAMSSTATRGYDLREDSPMPPIFANGLQISSLNGGQFYGDSRRLGSAESYTLQLDGLRVGTNYVLSFAKLQGSPPKFTLVGPFGYRHENFDVNSSITFRAYSNRHTVQIQVDRS